jgi:hypothetical protein
MIEEEPQSQFDGHEKGLRFRWTFFYDYIPHLFLSPRVAFCTSIIGCSGGDGIIHVFLVPCMFVLVIIPQCMKVDKTLVKDEHKMSI